MKPFDLQAALKGDKVLLRDGSTAIVAGYNPNAAPTAHFVGWADGGRLMSWNSDGSYLSERVCEADIIGRAQKKEVRTLWFNVYKSQTRGGQLYRCEAEAISNILSSFDDYIETRSVTFEVEV